MFRMAGASQSCSKQAPRWPAPIGCHISVDSFDMICKNSVGSNATSNVTMCGVKCNQTVTHVYQKINENEHAKKDVGSNAINNVTMCATT